jgi:hypothetical protein
MIAMAAFVALSGMFLRGESLVCLDSEKACVGQNALGEKGIMAGLFD